jgi:hypothetical protein
LVDGQGTITSEARTFGITVGAQYATLTVQAHHLSSGRFFL